MKRSTYFCVLACDCVLAFEGLHLDEQGDYVGEARIEDDADAEICHVEKTRVPYFGRCISQKIKRLLALLECIALGGHRPRRTTMEEDSKPY